MNYCWFCIHAVSLLSCNLVFTFSTRIGGGVKDLFKQEEMYKDRDGQIAAIQKTFEDAKKDITKHHSKPNVYPVNILPIYPDTKVSVLFACFSLNTYDSFLTLQHF